MSGTPLSGTIVLENQEPLAGGLTQFVYQHPQMGEFLHQCRHFARTRRSCAKHQRVYLRKQPQ